MSLLKICRYDGQTNFPPEISWYSAWIELTKEDQVHEAVLAANLNILRRDVPFVYFFANEKIVASESFHDIQTQKYYESLDSLELSRGLWLSNLSFEGTANTNVLAVLLGDILPFIHFLSMDEYALLCLPIRYSLKWIEHTISSARSNKEAINALLQRGGCILTIVDEVNFCIRTQDVTLKRYFEYRT